MSLLEAFEKLLASLIILAILVLIMFLAFDNERVVSTQGGERFDPRVEVQPDTVPAVRQTVQQDPAPPASPAPAPAPVVQTAQPQAPVNGKAPVPNPGTPPASPAPAPAPAAAPRQDMAKSPEQPPALTPEPKEPGKKYRNALIKETEPAQQSVAETKTARHEPTLKQTSAERSLPPATSRARRNEGVIHPTEYKKHPRTTYKKHARTASPSRSERYHYYDCTGGECSCDCDLPYWSQSDACADHY